MAAESTTPTTENSDVVEALAQSPELPSAATTSESAALTSVEDSALTPAESAVTGDADTAASALDSSTALSAASDAATTADAVPTASLADGDALAQLQDFLLTGGPVVWILIGLSVLALCIVLIKCWQLAMLRPESNKDLRRALSAWRNGEQASAIAQLQERRPVSAVTKLAMQGLTQKNAQQAVLKDELQRVAIKRMSELRAYLRPLEVIATLSPLLGLLGTVLGMIAAFQQMELAGSQVDPSVLSGGIWQALLTTAVGLSVAIPVMAIHNALERKVERVSELLNDSVTQVFTYHHATLVEHQVAEGLQRAA